MFHLLLQRDLSLWCGSTGSLEQVGNAGERPVVLENGRLIAFLYAPQGFGRFGKLFYAARSSRMTAQAATLTAPAFFAAPKNSSTV